VCARGRASGYSGEDFDHVCSLDGDASLQPNTE
jgi:hypothetical protein